MFLLNEEKKKKIPPDEGDQKYRK